MEDKKVKAGSVAVGICLFIIAVLLVVIVLGVYNSNKQKKELETIANKLQQTISEKDQKINDLEGKTNNNSEIVSNDNSNKIEKHEETQNGENNYISNFSNSVSKELGKDNMININLTGIDDKNSTGYLSINNKHEAHIYLSNFSEYSSANNLKKIADNVVNAWYCEQGQVPGNNYILFLKEDGTVTYVRFKTSFDASEKNYGKTIFESEEKTLNGINDISNIIPIGGNDENGIGGVGVLLIKIDGTCLPYVTLDDLINNTQKVNDTQSNSRKYITNFSNSVSKELGKDNKIYINLTGIDINNSTGYVSVNNKNEAHIYLSDYSGYSSANNLKKIADNVVNAWCCEQGQAPGNNYIVFLKEDGTVTYVRFRTTNDGKTNFESEEKTLNGITDISNIVTIHGNDANGIGGVGVLFIKTDGTCLPYSTLDDLTK